MAFNRTTVLTVGTPVKIALLEAGMFQNDAAKALGMPLPTFNMKLLGRRKFSDDERQKLSDLLGKSVEDLFPNFNHTECGENTQARVA